MRSWSKHWKPGPLARKKKRMPSKKSKLNQKKFLRSLKWHKWKSLQLLAKLQARSDPRLERWAAVQWWSARPLQSRSQVLAPRARSHQCQLVSACGPMAAASADMSRAAQIRAGGSEGMTARRKKTSRSMACAAKKMVSGFSYLCATCGPLVSTNSDLKHVLSEFHHGMHRWRPLGPPWVVSFMFLKSDCIIRI